MLVFQMPINIPSDQISDFQGCLFHLWRKPCSIFEVFTLYSINNEAWRKSLQRLCEPNTLGKTKIVGGKPEKRTGDGLLTGVKTIDFSGGRISPQFQQGRGFTHMDFNERSRHFLGFNLAGDERADTVVSSKFIPDAYDEGDSP
jgi:hypothetical protein